MPGRFCVSITHAKDNTDKATVGFVVANAALGSGKESLVFLSTEGVRLAVEGYADDIHEAGFAPLKQLMGDFAGNGGIPPLPGLLLHDFGDGGVSNLVLDAAPAVVLHWTDPFAIAANDYDLYVLSGDLAQVIRFSNDTQDGAGGDDDPVEIVSFFGSGAGLGERVVVARVAGVDRMINVVGFRGELEHATDGATRGHAAADATR